MQQETIRRFVECTLSVTACNLRCHYCYIAQLNDQNKGKMPVFSYSPEQVAYAFRQDRMGGVCLVNLCGAGETLLPRQIPDYIKAILGEGHYLMVVSNMLVDKHLNDILSAPKEHLERLFFKCSFHYLELKKRNLLEKFRTNVQKVWDAGCSATIEITPSDELEPYIEEAKEFSLKHFGAVPHSTVGRDETRRDMVHLPRLTAHSREEYEKIWNAFSSRLFEFKSETWDRKITDFCYAGKWSMVLDLSSGKTRQCYYSDPLPNFFATADRPIVESPVGTHCREPHCFNGHAFLALGLVPSMKCPSYLEQRDRERPDGSHWVNSRMSAVFSQKMYENNAQCEDEKKARLAQDERKSLYTKLDYLLRYIKTRIRRLCRPR